MKILVRPAPGLRVRMPSTQIGRGPVLDETTPAEGVEVERTMFVQLAIAAGDLVVVEEPRS